MTKLSFQDALFLRAESATTLGHVAALMILSAPKDASSNYLRRLARKLGRLNATWPIFNRKLRDPMSTANPEWVDAADFDPARHVLHYALPTPGRMQDLLKLVSAAHERLLDRGRPLWQIHLIEGLEGRRFAVYFKVHHALVDGVGGLRMVEQMLSADPACRTLGAAPATTVGRPPGRATIRASIEATLETVRRQSNALPEAASMLARLGLDSLLGGHRDRPLPPFAAPRTILNGQMDASRTIVLCELSVARVRAISKHYGGTINDVLVSICGAALRQYLLDQNALPRRTLAAGLPVSVKAQGDSHGNQLGIIVCPLGTNERDPRSRLRRVIRATRKAKSDMAHMSPGGTEDLGTMVMLPFLLMSLSHTLQAFPPVFNTIVSNVPGPRRPLYLDGARLERIYPLSVVTHGLGINITAISYGARLCIAITSCPTEQPGIHTLGSLMKRAYRELLATLE